MIVWVIWSIVEITWALAWKLRWAVIMLTSSSVRLTLADSSAPAWIRPRLEEPASPRTGSPDANVSIQAVSPDCWRPSGLGKLASAILPSGEARPLV